jgi:hypothetical protein
MADQSHNVRSTPSVPLPRPTLPASSWIVWAPTVAGCLLFGVTWLAKSMALTNMAAAVTVGGLVWVPVALALQDRIGAIPRARLLLGAVLIVQAMHTVEHLVQIIESYRLDYPPVRSLGVVSQLNVEWVHFGWNWLATAGVLVVIAMGGRTWAIGLLLAWITAHSLEHTYMLWRYLHVTSELDRLSVPRLGSSEVLPGVFGRDGWLALRLPGLRPYLGPLTAAPRVAIHLWWNVGEVALLVLACVVKDKLRKRRAT